MSAESKTVSYLTNKGSQVAMLEEDRENFLTESSRIFNYYRVTTVVPTYYVFIVVVLCQKVVRPVSGGRFERRESRRSF